MDNGKEKENNESSEEWTWYEQATDEGLKLVSKKDEQVWNYITQKKASEVAGKMYGADKPYTSDLVNRYAWDTAIVFIQKYSENNNYANQKALNYSEGKEEPEKTGTTEDKVCNIYDMASNCYELSTETSSFTDTWLGESPVVLRGGCGLDSQGYGKCAGGHLKGGTLKAGYTNYGFRPILYVQ